MARQKEGFIEVKGTQKKIGLTDVRKIFASGTRQALITCGKLTPKAKDFLDRNGKLFIENVSLEDVLSYDILQEKNND